MNAQSLIAELPPYNDQWVLINPNQTVKDIIAEVCDAHEEFAPYYDKIAYRFDGKNTDAIAEKIYGFLKQNVVYKEESDKNQTSALPTGILIRGKGDCKHYSGFAAGILDALNRQGKKIDWVYRFASYRLWDRTPHHVFVVINPGKDEIWIDPTPNAEKMTPFWQIDKKVKPMLHRNISGLGEQIYYEEVPQRNSIGMASVNIGVSVNVDNINFDGTGRYAGIWNPYLGLNSYRDYGGERRIGNKDQVAAELNALIAKGPDPNHAVDGNFVQWVYDMSLRSWNFYYQSGVRPGFSADNILPPAWPRPVLTPDGRLALSNNFRIDDHHNAELHILTAWIQDMVNKYDEKPFPVGPMYVQEVSLGKRGDLNTQNIMNEVRGASFIKVIGKALEHAVNFVKAGLLKVVGSIPRNAFLVLVRFNIFNIAKNLVEKINEGYWEQIANRWKSLGGNPDKLMGTIEDGKHKPDPGIKADSQEILASHNGEAIGQDPVSGATAATIIAAASPIIAAMLAFLPDKEGKLHDVLQATKAAAGQLFPDLDLDAYGFLDKNTGQRYDFTVDDADNEMLGGGNNDLPTGSNPYASTDPIAFVKNNPMIAAAGIGAALYLIPKKKNPLLAAAGAIATYFLLNKKQY